MTRTALRVALAGLVAAGPMAIAAELPAAFTDRMIQQVDKDDDGALSFEEYAGLQVRGTSGPTGIAPDEARERFDARDRNGDGRLDRAELAAYGKPRRSADAR